MKAKKRKPRARVGVRRPAARLPAGMRKTRVIAKSRLPGPEPDKTFTAMETGRLDEDRVPGIGNPAAAQGGLGPLNQEGEGERQNDELAALEGIEPEE